MNACTSLVLAGSLAAATLTMNAQDPRPRPLQLGAFSVSLTVKDLAASKAFYEKLDFQQVAGDIRQHWVVMQNGATTIGLFHGMFERNMLTFNPGWTPQKQAMADFQDVRELQRVLKERGVEFQTEADPQTDGPAHFLIADPDGNPILVDQHVPKPKPTPNPKR